jgi:hypothetical protein
MCPGKVLGRLLAVGFSVIGVEVQLELQAVVGPYLRICAACAESGYLSMRLPVFDRHPSCARRHPATLASSTGND